MEKIVEMINQSTSICFVLNIAIFQAKGKKMSNHFLVPSPGNMTIDEINAYLTLYFDELFVPFTSKEEVALVGSEQIRIMDAEIIDGIRCLNDTGRSELKLVLETKEQVLKSKIDETNNLRDRAIARLKSIDRSINNGDFLDTAACVKDLSKKLATLNFFQKRYSHYIIYLSGLRKSETTAKKLELKK